MAVRPTPAAIAGLPFFRPKSAVAKSVGFFCGYMYIYGMKTIEVQGFISPDISTPEELLGE
jgi:hypothetical protein